MLLVCLGCIFLFGYIFLTNKIKKGLKYFIFLSGFILFLYTALRGTFATTDAMGYLKRYEHYSNYTFRQIIDLYNSEIKNPTFYLLGWIVSRFFHSSQWWLAIIGAIYLSVVFYIIFKESQNPILSIIIFISLGFFSFSLTGFRQTVAMSLTMLAYYPAKKRKIFPFILLIISAMLFHSSAFIFFLIYPIANKKIGWGHLLVALLVAAIFLFFQGNVRNLISKLFEDSYLGGYADREEKLSLSGFIIQVAIFMFAMIYYPSVSKKYENANILYNLAFIGLLFQLFSSMIAEMFRISMYFSFFNVLLIPMVLSAEKDTETKNLLLVVLTIIFLWFLFRNGIPAYKFFWQ